ncbi:MAG: chromosome segregation protein [Patescibacteria group bacterium]|jgi:chromosome segregation protein|nr:chromosome segregation protein [Patescibacteria group bacterium]
MHLKAIELNGFKSFGKKSRLDFTHPLTCVVGPNGSGKSNVVESFRFVLGEQSMKSLRGKSGKDLIFKGSSGVQKQNRAYVSINFDNKNRVFKLPSGDSPINVDFDEISIKREVFADGNNSYYINNTEVRLRDIVELLASVNIGSSGHHIISQGHADRVLTASTKERRGMIEDALGLKIYQYRLKESEKKLSKTKENIKEIESIRRELAPHLRYLKKQVEKIQKGEELRGELTTLYLLYFKREHAYLGHEESFIKKEKSRLKDLLDSLNQKISNIKIEDDNSFEIQKTAEIDSILEKVRAFRFEKENLSRSLGKIEGLVELEEAKVSRGDSSITIKNSEFNSFIDSIHDDIDSALSSSDLTSAGASLKKIKDDLSSFRQKYKLTGEVSREDLDNLLESKKGLLSKISELDKSIEESSEKVSLIRNEISKNKEDRYKAGEEKFTLENERNRVASSLEVIENKNTIFLRRKTLFEENMKEAVVLVGQNILGFEKGDDNIDFRDEEQEDLRRQIERLKIKLEDIGTGGGFDVLKEYEETAERDNFLIKELADLEGSIKSLETLIDELKVTLDTEFKTGLTKINERFEEFFKLMFGGGGAFLSIVVEKPKKLDENMDETDVVEEDKSFEQGIDINVSLPQKKVKDLAMLSGGERSLTSIALLFAMSQVNPPPFLVLDETDAALDEANSKRYGDMLERLSKYSELIVVTHNRETMSRADLIYGVTIGGDGASKLLSIKFAEAEGYAK